MFGIASFLCRKSTCISYDSNARGARSRIEVVNFSGAKDLAVSQSGWRVVELPATCAAGGCPPPALRAEGWVENPRAHLQAGFQAPLADVGANGIGDSLAPPIGPASSVGYSWSLRNSRIILARLPKSRCTCSLSLPTWMPSQSTWTSSPFFESRTCMP